MLTINWPSETINSAVKGTLSPALVPVVLVMLFVAIPVQAATVEIMIVDNSGSDDRCVANVKGVGTFENEIATKDVDGGKYSVQVSLKESKVGPHGSCRFEVLSGGRVLSGPGASKGVIGLGAFVGMNNCCDPGKSVNGEIEIFGPKLKITSPEGGEKDFLVETREDGSIVRAQNEISISAKIENKPDDFNGEITWSFDGDVDNEDESTEPGESATVGLTGERDESGRGEPMEVDIKAEVTVNGEELEDEVSIDQIKGEPAFNVVRQEYEDVKAETNKKRKEAVDFPTDLFGGKFTKDDSSQFYDLISVNYDYAGEYGYFRSTMEQSLDQLTFEMRSITNEEGNLKYPNWRFDVISGYRNPAHNGALKEKGLTTENPSGNSQHIYGFATDIRKAVPQSDNNRKKQSEVFKLLLKYAGSFYGDGGKTKWFQQTSPHLNWPKSP